MNGKQFVKNLVAEYGLLEGYRMAESYLEIPYDESDSEETQFRSEMRAEMSEVDNI